MATYEILLRPVSPEGSSREYIEADSLVYERGDAVFYSNKNPIDGRQMPKVVAISPSAAFLVIKEVPFTN